MKKIIFFILFPFFVFASVIDDLDKIIKSNKAIQGEFIQKSYISGFNQPEIFKGEIYITKPDKIKIIYKEPLYQQIYIDSKKFIVYTPSEKQAVISKKNDDLIIVDIFEIMIGNKNLKDILNIKKEISENNHYKIQTVPKNNKDIKLLTFIFSKEDMKLKTVEALDNEDNKVVIEFSKFNYLNKDLNLKIDIPKDINIINY